LSITEVVPSVKEIALLSIDLKSLKALLEKTGFTPYAGIPGLNSNSIQIWLDELSQSSKEKNLILEKEKDSIVGAASLEALPFDTDLYGIPMAKISFLEALGDAPQLKKRQKSLIDKIFEMCQKEGTQHLSIRALPNQLSLIHSLEEKGFYMVAGLSTLLLDLKKFQYENKNSQVKIRPFIESDLEPLCEISLQSFGNPLDWMDRSHADPHLPKDKSDELYVRWFRNCCNGSQADQVLVAELDGKPVGYIALKLESGGPLKSGVRVGNIPLNAVDPDHRQKGIYAALVQEGLKWFSVQVDWVTIKTQVTTLPVHKTWQRLGAQVSQIEYAFHKYFGEKKT